MHIRYPNESFLPDLKDSLIRDTAGVPFYLGGPEPDYGKAPVAFAANISLLYREGYQHIPGDDFTPLPCDEVLLVRRAHGTHGKAGTESGVSGYIGHRYNPSPNYRPVDEVFDPIAHTAAAELQEEIGLERWYIDEAIDFRVGRLATEKRTQFPGAIIHSITMAGVLCGPERPELRLNKKELSSARWLPLREVVDYRGVLAKNYLDTTLPEALAATGIGYRAAVRLLLSGGNVTFL